LLVSLVDDFFKRGVGFGLSDWRREEWLPGSKMKSMNEK
jgi:hypothetical protein